MKVASVLTAVAMICSLFLFAPPTFAHHSFAAEFDANKCRDFTGTLTKLDWQSPHAYFYMDIKNAKLERWKTGRFRHTRSSRSEGTERTVSCSSKTWVRKCGSEDVVAKNGKERYAAAGTLKFSDGVLHQVGQLQD